MARLCQWSAYPIAAIEPGQVNQGIIARAYGD